MTIDQLKEAALKATPGPWRHNRNERTNSVGTAINDAGHSAYGMAICVCQMQIEKSYNNAAYIAAASPDVILDLIQKLEAATKWVSVSQELPPDCNDVQIYVYGTVETGYYISHAKGWMRYMLDGTEDCTPTHWASLLPAPPNESPEDIKR